MNENNKEQPAPNLAEGLVKDLANSLFEGLSHDYSINDFARAVIDLGYRRRPTREKILFALSKCPSMAEVYQFILEEQGENPEKLLNELADAIERLG